MNCGPMSTMGTPAARAAMMPAFTVARNSASSTPTIASLVPTCQMTSRAQPDFSALFSRIKGLRREFAADPCVLNVEVCARPLFEFLLRAWPDRRSRAKSRQSPRSMTSRSPECRAETRRSLPEGKGRAVGVERGGLAGTRNSHRRGGRTVSANRKKETSRQARQRDGCGTERAAMWRSFLHSIQ